MSNAVLPNDPKALKAILADRDEYISELQEQVRWLKAVIHAATSERRAKPNANERQYSLFDEAENTSKSYMWLARGGPPGKPGVLFHYSPSRSGKIAEELVRDFSGYLQTDGYAGYNALGEREGIIHVGCMAHVRRKFMDVLKAGTKKRGTAQEVVDLIAQLYGLEKQARQAGFDADRILAMRQNQSRQIMDTIKALLLERGQPTPPKSLLGRAIAYALGQWERVETYLEDGILLPDNNLAENAIRPFAVGRKNWLFSGSPRGAAASAALYSLVETAKANGLEPLRYLHFLFEELPGVKSDDERRSLLPQYLAPEELV